MVAHGVCAPPLAQLLGDQSRWLRGKPLLASEHVSHKPLRQGENPVISALLLLCLAPVGFGCLCRRGERCLPRETEPASEGETLPAGPDAHSAL